MLPAEITSCIRHSIDAELPMRDQSVSDSLQRSASEFSLRGAFHSSMMLQARARIGCDELTVRAEIIWGLIQRCHRVFGIPVGEQLGHDLEEQIHDHLARHGDLVVGMVDSTGPVGLGPQWRGQISALVRKRHDELFKKFSNEARLYALAAAQGPRAEPSTYTFNAPVGAVQTGANAISHIHIDAAGGARLAQALEQLQAAIPHADGLPAEQRANSEDLVRDLIAAARAPTPNGPKLFGLLNGLAVTVQTVASVRGAWDLVRDAALVMGIPLP